MTRINLFDYRYQEIYYRKLRICWLIAITIIVSLGINIFIYIYYQIRILQQETRNTFFAANIDILNRQLKPINEYNVQLKLLNQQLKLLSQIEAVQDDMLAFCQQINKLTPPQIYFTQIDWESAVVSFSGVAKSPLYLADFLDKLRNKKGIFIKPVLKSNTAIDREHYDFLILAGVKPDLMVESADSND